MPKLTTNGWTTHEALMDREPFTTRGALSAIAGSNGTGYNAGTGKLPEPWATQYRDDSARITYTVMSYQTPIAWVLDDGTVVKPPVTYSITTSGHQSMLYALDTARLSFDQRAGIRESAQRERDLRRMARHAREDRAREVHTAPYSPRVTRNDEYSWGDSAMSDASDYDALIAEVGELSKPVR